MNDHTIRTRHLLLRLAGLWLVSLAFASAASAACVDGSPMQALRGIQSPPSLSDGFMPAVFHPDTGPSARLISVDYRNDDFLGDLVGRIVGTWRVKYTGFPAPESEAFIQWHSDGTEWENIALPILGGTICMGDWKAIDENHVRRSHVGWMFSNGLPVGYFTEIETDVVARDGRSYHGTNTSVTYDLAGNQTGTYQGTAVATRISPP